MQEPLGNYFALDLILAKISKGESRLLITILEDFHKLFYHCSGNTRSEISVCRGVYFRASIVLLQADASETIDVEAEISLIGNESSFVIFVETLMSFLGLYNDILYALRQRNDVSFQTGIRGSPRPNADEEAFAVRPHIFGLSFKKLNGIIVA